MSDVIIVGDSQSGCFSAAINDASFRAELRNKYAVRQAASGRVVQEFVLDLASGESIVNPAVSMAVSKLNIMPADFWQKNRVMFMFGGAEHNRWGLCGQVFGFGDKDAHESLGYAPKALVRAFFEAVFERIDRGLEIIGKQAGAGNFFVLQGPPPAPANEAMEAFFLSMPGMEKNFKAVADAAFRVRIYKIAVETLAAITQKHGGVFVRAPKELADAQGLLPPHLVADPYHANAEYGKIFLRKIDQMFT